MKTEKDAYGKEIWAYLNGDNNVKEIVERDDGFIDLSSGPPAYFAEYKNWKDYEKKAIKLIYGKVLDIGCGAGRVSLYLQNKGFDVLGIDNSPFAFRVCKKRGLKKTKNIGIEKASELRERFDTIILLGNNFGLFGSYKKAKSLLKSFHKITSDNALIIADSLDPYGTRMREHLEYHNFNMQRGRMAGQLRIRIRFRKCIGDWFDYLLVSKQEMKEILEGTGWKIKKFIDSKSASYIAVIEKEKKLK
jgi:SAM-dependent methyltransferase